MLGRWLPDPTERRAFLRWAWIALGFHVLAGICTVGWYGYDEHWQILEFANALVGRGATKDLPWEYASRVRPALQPVLYAGIERLLLAAHVTSPWIIAGVFRVLTASVAWAAMMLAGLACLAWFPSSPARRWVAPTLALFWFLPYLHARTSSENSSEAAFLAGFGVLFLTVGGTERLSEEQRGRLSAGLAALVGLLFGLSFEFRFQSGFMVAGACLWSAFVARFRFRILLAIAAGVLGGIAIGLAADRLLYGEWTFAPWNYFRVNIIEHKASGFGTSPWWVFFKIAPERLAPPLSIAVLAGLFWGWGRRPLSLMTWSLVPFLLGHVVVAHKEFRFLFPMATLSVLLTLRGVDDARTAWPIFWERAARSRWARAFLWLVAIEDVGLLVGSSLRPAEQTLPFCHTIYDLAREPMVIYFRKEDPFLFGDLTARFYKPAQLTMEAVPDLKAFAEKLKSGDQWLVDRGFELPDTEVALRQECVSIARTMPPWIRHFDFNGWVGRTPVWALYRCHGATEGTAAVPKP